MTHILIVEDHEENRNLLKMLLEANGYRVTAAGDGIDALAAARRDRPDAIVSDALMPNMDGFDLCRQWMQDTELKTIPFIFYSATYVRPVDELFAEALGAVRYLIKPLEAEVFLGELRGVLHEWTGRTAPIQGAPLDDATIHLLHESALARKLEDKIAQLEQANRKLQESEARFRGLTEMSSDFYWESDVEHRLTLQTSAANVQRAVPVFARDAQVGERRWEVPHLSPDAAAWAAHRTALDAHQPFREFELSRLGTDGKAHFISISGDPVFDTEGVFIGYRGVGTDITKRKQGEQALRDSAEKLRLFTDNVPAMTASFDENLRLLLVNKRFADFFGYGATEILGKRLREIVGDRVYGEIEGHFAQVLQGHAVTYQRTRKLHTGEIRHLEIKLLPHVGDQGKVQGCFVVAADITDHVLAEERIQRVAHHDTLTGLPNRLLFSDRLGQTMSLAKRNSRQFALLYLDLDKFKPVNDALGHTAGDELLKSVAVRIRGQVRESDTVARVGGDEFTVILPDIAMPDNAEFVARKIMAALAAPFQLCGQAHSVCIGTSIGIAIYPSDARDADALVEAADAAMYSAKQAGSTICFYAT